MFIALFASLLCLCLGAFLYIPDGRSDAARKVGQTIVAISVAVAILCALSIAAVVSASVDCTLPGRNTIAVPAPECVNAGGEAISCATAGAIRLWPSRLQPATPTIPPSRYSTDLTGGTSIPGEHSGFEIFSSVDIVEDRLYVSYNSGWQQWKLAPNPANPLLAVSRDGWCITTINNCSSHRSEFAYFPAVSEILNYNEDISAISIGGGTDYVAVAGSAPVGVSLWRNSHADGVVTQIYQDIGVEARQVEIVPDGSGMTYAVVGSDGGVVVYNVTVASALGLPCENSGHPTLPPPLCVEPSGGASIPDVYRGKVTELSSPYVGALVVNGTLYVSAASFQGGFTLRLWSVNPISATGVVLATGPNGARGNVLFGQGGRYYLAAVVEAPSNVEKLYIYDVTGCLNGGACSLAAPISSPIPLSGQPSVPGSNGYPTTNDYLDYSPPHYLYYGFATGGAYGPSQDELYDLSLLANGTVSAASADGGHYTDPCTTVSNQQYEVGYFGHYYSRNAHGLNNFTPRVGMVSSLGYLYRAAATVLDVHKVSEPAFVPLIFADGFESGDTSRW